MKLRSRFKNQIALRVTSADFWKSVEILNDRGIALSHIIREDDLTHRFWIHRRDYMPLLAALEKRGDSIHILERPLLYYIQQSILNRWLLYSGLSLFFVLSLLLPTRILTVQVEGNHTVATRKILEAAQETGIRLFAPCAEVRSEEMKNALLCAIPELQWAGINTFGCRAVICVEERVPPETEAAEKGTVGSIVAARDGIIESVTALQGTAMCQPGQAVRKGQILISGYTDCEIALRAQRARGEVYARTMHTLSTVTPASQQVRQENPETKKALAILFGKKRINLWKDSGISEVTCGRISREHPLTLAGGFSLPIALVCDTYLCGTTAPFPVDKMDAQNRLLQFSQEYLSGQMIAGRVAYSDDVLEARPGAYWLTRQFFCVEMIGREHLENGDSQ